MVDIFCALKHQTSDLPGAIRENDKILSWYFRIPWSPFCNKWTTTT